MQVRSRAQLTAVRSTQAIAVALAMIGVGMMGIIMAEPWDLYAYHAKLRAFLQVPVFEAEAAGADFALRALIRPSFHPECAVSVTRRGAAASLFVRCASDSSWSVSPISERIAVGPEEIAELEKLAGAMRTWKPTESLGLDGMTTTFEVLLQGTTSKHEVWHEGGAPDEVMRMLGRLITKHDSKTARLAANWAGYLHDH